MNIKISKAFLLITLFLISTHIKASSSEAGKKFNAGEMIIEHVIDQHEWHIAKIGDTHVTVPLPIIFFDNGKLEVFMSSKFHHGTEAYNGYKICDEVGPHKGKIVKLKADGTIDESASIIDLSITKNVFALLFGMILITFIMISVARSYTKRRGLAPKGLQSFIEPLILFVRDDIAKPAIGKHYAKYLPFLLTIFFFILINNLLGLIPFFPGGANVTGNLAVTGVLALFTFFITAFSGNKNYWQHIFNAPGVPWWLKLPIPLMPVVELVGIFTKPFVLMVRLFANITAGHIIALGFVSLIFIFGERSIVTGYSVSVVSVAFYIFMGLLELLVAFIQAYVFTLLSSIYFGMAIEEHHHKKVESL
ncbi:MAG: F0F1 ATP synthase subunit A [Bacteroidota bacterium]|jgi:F-type H+-transporting ATPase subunit a